MSIGAMLGLAITLGVLFVITTILGFIAALVPSTDSTDKTNSGWAVLAFSGIGIIMAVILGFMINQWRRGVIPASGNYGNYGAYGDVLSNARIAGVDAGYGAV